LRYDIHDGGLTIYTSDIENIEETYNITYPEKFPRKAERGGMDLTTYLDETDINLYEQPYDIDITGVGIVYQTKYGMDKRIFLNYLSFIYCTRCVNNFKYYECIGEMLYILSTISTIIYNNLCHPTIYTIIHTDPFDIFRSTVSKKLYEIKTKWVHPPYSHLWKGYTRYHKLIGLLPLILEKAGVPEEHYIRRANDFFSDSICGHPMASHGWFAESLQDTLKLGGIVD